MELAFESPQLTRSRTVTSCPCWALLRLQICKQNKCCCFKLLSFGVIYYTAEELEYLLNSVIESVLFSPETTNLTCLAGCKQSQTCFWIWSFQSGSSYLGHVGHNISINSFSSSEVGWFFLPLFIIYGKSKICVFECRSFLNSMSVLLVASFLFPQGNVFIHFLNLALPTAHFEITAFNSDSFTEKVICI